MRAGILGMLLALQAPCALRADWAPEPDCREQGVDCDADASVVGIQEVQLHCTCAVPVPGGADEEDGCSCAAPGGRRTRTLPAGVVALGLLVASWALWRERRRP